MFKAKRFVLVSYSTFPGATVLEDFREMAAAAAEAGFTHISISELTARSRHQLTNNGEYCSGYDFYPEYTAIFPGFFKFHVPKALAPFLPADYAKNNLEALAKRAAIAQEYGLKTSFFGGEPQWLPESVYEKHPHWRGPRCDVIQRSLQPYFAPCIDQPEILELYKEAGRVIAGAAPNLDTLGFLTNDSGSGLCWHEGLYPGQNGPAFCKSVPMQERLERFMDALTCGLKEKGQNPLVYFAFIGWSTRGLIKLYGTSKAGSTLAIARAPQDKPVLHENPLAILADLETANEAGAETVVCGIEGSSFFSKRRQVHSRMIKYFKESPSQNLIDRLAILRKSLDGILTGQNCDWLLNSWVGLEKALDVFSRLGRANHFFYLHISQRWLTRPLVPFPLELTHEEKDYYAKHIFNVLGEKYEADLLDLHGGRWISIIKTPAELWRAEQMCNYALDNLDAAVRNIGQILNNKCPPAAREYLEDSLARIKMLSCFARNFKNIIKYQALLDSIKDRETSLAGINAGGGGSSIKNIRAVIAAEMKTAGSQLNNIMRDEIENTREIIDLIQKSKTPLLQLARTEKDENTFLFSPKIVEQLKAKIKIMIRHWRDPQRWCSFDL